MAYSLKLNYLNNVGTVKFETASMSLVSERSRRGSTMATYMYELRQRDELGRAAVTSARVSHFLLCLFPC